MFDKIKSLKTKPLYVVLFLASLILSGCESCSCNTTCEGPNINASYAFGGGYYVTSISSGCFRQCATLSSYENKTTKSEYNLFLVNLFKHEVIDVTETYPEYDFISYEIITDSMAYKIRKKGGGEQLLVWDYETPVRELGNSWAYNAQELVNRCFYNDSIPYSRSERIYVDKNYFTYSYSCGSKLRNNDTLNVFFRVNMETGEAGPYREEGGRDISQWNNVVYAYGDFYGIDTKNLDTAYLYKYDMETKVWDSLFIDMQKQYSFFPYKVENYMDISFSFSDYWNVMPKFPYDRSKDLAIKVLDGIQGLVIDTENFSVKYEGIILYNTDPEPIFTEKTDDDIRYYGYYDSIPVDITYKNWLDWKVGNGVDGTVDIEEKQ